jgi:Cof subfamily protein (haloacid dehalogenase superfamily)
LPVFDGVLLCSDLDGTLLPHNLPIAPKNAAALRRFMAEGGRFTVATGRAKETFEPKLRLLRVNAPVILANGALIYDFASEAVLHTDFFPEAGLPACEDLNRRFPRVALEVHTLGRIYVCNPNEYTNWHLGLLENPKNYRRDVAALGEVPFPWLKALCVGDAEELDEIAAYVAQTYGGAFSSVLSCPNLLELQSPTATKGDGVAWLAERLGVRDERVYCIGDYDNDLPMLTRFYGFAPEGAADSVKPHVRQIVGPCEESSLYDAIEIIREQVR